MPDTDAKTINRHIGARIKRRRKILGVTQKELGDGVGVRFQQIQKYESGANAVSAPRLYQLAEALDVEFGYFFADLEPGQPLGSAPEADEGEVIRVAATIAGLPERVRERIRNLALAIVSDGQAQ